MRKLWIAILAGGIVTAACAPAAGAPAPTAPVPLAAPTAREHAIATTTPTATPAPSESPRPSAKADPLPDAFLGAWYHPSPAYWWFLRAGSPTCIKVAHTDGDCVAYQIGSQPAYVGAATMDGRVLRIRWTRGYCAGARTNFGTGIAGDTLKLFDTEGDCGGENFVLARAGVGAAPSAPAPPES